LNNNKIWQRRDKHLSYHVFGAHMIRNFFFLKGMYFNLRVLMVYIKRRVWVLRLDSRKTIRKASNKGKWMSLTLLNEINEVEWNTIHTILVSEKNVYMFGSN